VDERLPPNLPPNLAPDIVAAHDAAVAAGEGGYFDPRTGLFVMTEAYLAARGTCCESGCRHCPYQRCEEGDYQS
jgi:Family of unknown function (DUF5522)